MLDLVARVFPGEEEAMVSKFAEELLSEGKRLGWVEGVARGKAEGKVEGMLEGEAKMLLRQLRSRFSTVSDQCQQAVLSANADQLEAWVRPSSKPRARKLCLACRSRTDPSVPLAGAPSRLHAP